MELTNMAGSVYFVIYIRAAAYRHRAQTHLLFSAYLELELCYCTSLNTEHSLS